LRDGSPTGRKEILIMSYLICDKRKEAQKFILKSVEGNVSYFRNVKPTRVCQQLEKGCNSSLIPLLSYLACGKQVWGHSRKELSLFFALLLNKITPNRIINFHEAYWEGEQDDNLSQTSWIDRFVTTGFTPDLPIHIAGH
jgi:hypothetical protein